MADPLFVFGSPRGDPLALTVPTLIRDGDMLRLAFPVSELDERFVSLRLFQEDSTPWTAPLDRLFGLDRMALVTRRAFEVCSLTYVFFGPFLWCV